jgi:type II secretory pathway pseudopilin PulG
MKKSFTIIELVIVIAITGILSISFLKGFQITQKELSSNVIDTKLLNLKNSIYQTLINNPNSFLSTNKIINQNGDIIYTINSTHMLRNFLDYDGDGDISDTSDTQRLNIINFFNLNEKDLTDIGANPIMVTFNYNILKETISYPIINISVVSWGELNRFSGFESIKPLFQNFQNVDGNIVFSIKKYQDITGGDKVDVDNFLNDNDLTYQIFQKNIKTFTLNNNDIIKEKVLNSLGKFEKITNNLSHWVNEKIKAYKLNSLNSVYGKDFFLFGYREDETINSIYTDNYNPNYIEDLQKSDTEDSSGGTKTITLEDFSNNFIILKNTYSDNLNTEIIGSSHSPTDTIFNDTTQSNYDLTINGNTITLTNLLPLKKFDSLTNIDNSNLDYFIPKTSLSIIGINSISDGSEDFLNIPFFFGNTPTMNINGSITFDNNTPFNNNYPPYSSTLVLLFPWIQDLETTAGSLKTVDNNYGIYSKQIFSVEEGY